MLLPKLTLREISVIKLVGHGKTNQQIADKLDLSLNSIKSYMQDILKKTKLENRTALALWYTYYLHPLQSLESRLIDARRKKLLVLENKAAIERANRFVKLQDRQ